MTREQQRIYFIEWINKGGAEELVIFAEKKSSSHLGDDEKKERAHDFVAYILENMVKILDGKPLNQANLLETVKYAWNRFLSTDNDRARTKEGDGAKYLYKRLSDALPHSHKFTTCYPEGLSEIQARGLKLVGITATSQSFKGAHQYPKENFRDWPALPTALSLTEGNANKDIKLTRQWLLSLVDFYWSEFSQKYPERSHFLLYDLVNYILVQYPWLAPKEVYSYTEEQAEDNVAESSQVIVAAATTDSPEERLTRLKDQQVFGHICAQVFAGIKRLDSCVFYYRCSDPQWTYQKIADHFGLTNQSQARTIEDKVKKIIKNLISSAFPGPGFPDLSPETQRAYINHLYTYSKNRCLES